jgi:hypothetical protein
MAQAQKKLQERGTVEEIEELPQGKEVDHSVSDALLDEIDELLAEEEKRLYKEKLRSLSLVGRRASDPCGDTIRVPESLVETFLRAGCKEAKGGGCCEDCG